MGETVASCTERLEKTLPQLPPVDPGVSDQPQNPQRIPLRIAGTVNDIHACFKSVIKDYPAERNRFAGHFVAFYDANADVDALEIDGEMRLRLRNALQDIHIACVVRGKFGAMPIVRDAIGRVKKEGNPDKFIEAAFSGKELPAGVEFKKPDAASLVAFAYWEYAPDYSSRLTAGEVVIQLFAKAPAPSNE